MPLVECFVNNVTPKLTQQLEEGLATAIRESVAQALPPELGYTPGTPEYQLALDISRKLMPGWTWIAVSPMQWSIGGKHIDTPNTAVARIHILVLEQALEAQYQNHILEAVTHTAKEILGGKGKKVHLAVSMIEGSVDMTLPRELFAGLSHGEPEELLLVENVESFIRGEVLKASLKKKAK